MKYFIAQDGQNIFDLAIIAYGDASKVPQLINENSGLQLNAKSYSGIRIGYTPGIGDVAKKARLSLTNIVPATASYEGGSETFLLQENGFDILLEDGNKIQLE